jgi:hypothetical protein
MSTVRSRYQEMSSEDRDEFMCAVLPVIFGLCNSVRLLVTVLKSVARERLEKIEKILCVL